MSTMTMTAPFFCIDVDEEQQDVQNSSIALSDFAYTKTNTANIINKYQTKLIDIICELLKNGESYEHSSVNNKLLGEFMEKYYYTKRKIYYNNTTFEFNIDFFYEIYKDISEDLYIAQNEFFDIYGYGDTLFEAEQDLYNTLYELWEIYAEEDDNNLDNKAKAIKEKLITYIRKLD